MIRGAPGYPRVRPVRYHRAIRPHVPAPCARGDRSVSSPPTAKFFVNTGVVASRTDMLHLLRPLLKQTVTYRYLRGRDLVAHGTGWVERIVTDAPDTSTYFTPWRSPSTSIRSSISSSRRAPTSCWSTPWSRATSASSWSSRRWARGRRTRSPFAPRQLAFDTSDYVQMELLGLDAHEDE